jgi:hypothetical protein
MAIPRTEVDLILGDIDQNIEAAVDEQILGEVDSSRFVPKDEVALDWQLRRRIDKQERIALLKRARDQRIEIIKAEFQARIEELEFDIEQIEELIYQGLSELRDEAEANGEQLNALSSPSGRAYFKKNTEVEYPDVAEDPTAFKSLVELGRAIGVDPRVKLELNKADLKKHMSFAEDGDGNIVVAIDGRPTDLVKATRNEKMQISKL